MRWAEDNGLNVWPSTLKITFQSGWTIKGSDLHFLPLRLENQGTNICMLFVDFNSALWPLAPQSDTTCWTSSDRSVTPQTCRFECSASSCSHCSPTIAFRDPERTLLWTLQRAQPFWWDYKHWWEEERIYINNLTAWYTENNPLLNISKGKETRKQKHPEQEAD